jgi:L-aspartate oxidase
MDSCDSDVLIVGGGAAGLCAALNAAPRRVLLIAPEGSDASCTQLAQGGIAAPVAARDSIALHVADTLRAARLALAEAMIVAALRRRESRGAHWRRDFPQRDRSFDGARALSGATGATGKHRGGRPLLTHCR